MLQPKRLRDSDETLMLRDFRPNLQVVVAYGQILPKQVLEIPKYGTINSHASLLPRWRGAAPISAAIRAGDEQTGITIMLVDEGEDTGDILEQHIEPILNNDDAGSLSKRLSEISASLLIEMIPRWVAGKLTQRNQDDNAVTYARKLSKHDGIIQWDQPAMDLDRQIRALKPWPGTTTTIQGEKIKILSAAFEDSSSLDSEYLLENTPGTIVKTAETISVQTGQGVLRLKEIQPSGKKPKDAAAYLRGKGNLIGVKLGDSEGLTG